MKSSYILAFIIILVAGCSKGSNPLDTREPFEIFINSPNGAPIADVTVEGGIDWDYFRIETDGNGKAFLPAAARNTIVHIYKNNFMPLVISNILPGRYILNETSKILKLLGNATGKAVRFKNNELITLDYQGNYHQYSFNDEAIIENFTRHLNDSAIAIREIKVLGDTLWFTTHNSGVFAYSIVNPTSPVLLFRLPIPGYLGPFAVKDSIIVLGNPLEPGPLRIYRYYTNGKFREISDMESYYVKSMLLIGNSLFLIGGNESLPTVFDISNPDKPLLLHNGLEWDAKSGFFYRQMLVLTPAYAYGGTKIILDYKIINLSIPSILTPLKVISADSWIEGIVSDNYAYGPTYTFNQAISVLEGNILSGFQTVAVISDNTIDGVGGANPPYFLIGNRLWKLANR